MKKVTLLLTVVVYWKPEYETHPARWDWESLMDELGTVTSVREEGDQ